MWYVIGCAVVIAGYLVLAYNSLVGKRNKVRNSWSQIDVQLKRRFDLIPNIVETVKGYAAHEKDTFEKITEARSRFANGQTQKDIMSANNEMSGLLSRLFAVAENYPQLKADENFMQLQQELARTEDKISFTRQFYNDTVLDYNNTVQMFPSNIAAMFFSFKEAEFMAADEKEKEVVRVKF